jgi:hypothetical protein
MIIFTEGAHKEALRRIELVKHFQDKYFSMLNISALNCRHTEYIKAYEAYKALNLTLSDTVKSFVWGTECYEAKSDLEWRLELLHRELDAIGEQIVTLKSNLKSDNEMQSMLSSYNINFNKKDSHVKHSLSNVSVSPDNSVYFKPGEMPKFHHSPIGVASGLSPFKWESGNNTTVFINSSNSNNNVKDENCNDNQVNSLKYGKK